MSGNIGARCGASASQDARFSDKMKKLLKTTKFPPEFDTRIDMKRVKLEVLLPWISQQMSKYLGFEDEVVIGYVESQLQQPGGGKVDPKQMQLYLTGFLEHNTPTFMKDLWALLISAQENELGVPTEFLERKKEEIRQKKEEQARAAAAHARTPQFLAPVLRAGSDRRGAQGQARRGGAANGRGGPETARPRGDGGSGRRRKRERRGARAAARARARPPARLRRPRSGQGPPPRLR